jgi:hypothetical protein
MNEFGLRSERRVPPDPGRCLGGLSWGLIQRNPDPDSKSVVRVTLTRSGPEKLDALAETHLQELAHLAPTMRTLWQALEAGDGEMPHPAARRTSSTGSSA